MEEKLNEIVRTQELILEKIAKQEDDIKKIRQVIDNLEIMGNDNEVLLSNVNKLNFETVNYVCDKITQYRLGGLRSLMIANNDYDP